MLKTKQNLGANGGFTLTKFWGARSRDRVWRPKIGIRWTGFNRYISVLMKKGLWFLKMLSITFLLVRMVYPSLDTIFLFFFVFFISFFFFFQGDLLLSH